MPPPDLRVSDVAIRKAVQRAVEALSLRMVARTIGMSAPGLQHFLDGGTPLLRTKRKLMSWYVREGPAWAELHDDEIRIAVGALLDRLPPEVRAEASAEIAALLRALYRKKGLTTPVWMTLPPPE